MSASNKMREFEFTHALSQNNNGRMSHPSSNELHCIQITYILSQDSRGENVSDQLVMTNLYHLQADPGQPQRKCQYPVAREINQSRTPWANTTTAGISVFDGMWETWFSDVQSNPWQPWWECQYLMRCDKLKSRTPCARKTVVRLSVFDSWWEIETTYNLSHDDRGHQLLVYRT